MYTYKYVLAVILSVLFAATVPLANWMVGNFGTCVPQGPCLVPVGFGLMAPSGVLVIGVSLVLRDLVHETGGLYAALAAIVLGLLVSFFVAPSSLIIASCAAFALSELADLAVYTPLREKRFGLAVLLSGIVGALIDSAVFLTIAFGSLQFVEGQWLGKVWASLAAFIVLVVIRWFRTPEAGEYRI